MYYALLNFMAWAFVMVCLFGLLWFIIATPFVWLIEILNNQPAKQPTPVHVRCLEKEAAIKQKMRDNQSKMDESQRKWKEKMADNRGLWG